MPPNRKISNWSPSAGLSSIVAAGSSRHILGFLVANISSTFRCSTSSPFILESSAGICNEVGTDVKRNLAPAAQDSRAVQPYSRADQGPSSGSKCSTAYITGVLGEEPLQSLIPELINKPLLLFVLQRRERCCGWSDWYFWHTNYF